MKKLIIIFLIIMLLIPIISLAQEIKEEDFISCNSNEISKEDILTITIDLTKITYEEFKFTLNSNIDLTEIDIETDDVDVDVNKNQLEIYMKKSEMTLNNIILSYKIPENLDVGDNIEIVGKIEDIKTGEYKENVINVNIIENMEEEIEEPEQEFNDMQEKEENFQENSNNKENNMNFNQNYQNAQVEETNLITTQNVSVLSITSNSFNESFETEESITYDGESNNYLSSLIIDGLEILPTFSKTCQNYFVEVESDVSSVTINAEAEDENAKITLYGNENLQEGKNKILVSVTAENGNVRFYRIYVTKNS